jgi:predicted small secreted protein
MQKIAIIYTGEVRTCETTLPLFKKNVLLNSDFHVFSVVQSMNNIEYFKNIITENIGENLKSLTFFDKNDTTWNNLRDELLSNMNIDGSWIYYLKNSGSIIEYYQMYLAYKNMEEYENKHGFSYDYVLRFRTDTVLKDEINFNYEEYSKDYIRNLMYEIKTSMNYDKIISNDTITHFMNVFYYKNRVNYKNIRIHSKTNSNDFNYLLTIQNEEEFIRGVENYLKEGNYLITLRNNIIYFMKRKHMTNIHILGITYGNYKSENNDYWFNAESQLEQICIQNDIDFFSSTTELEDKSLYNYNHTDYFDENNNLLDNEYLFFIKRY